MRSQVSAELRDARDRRPSNTKQINIIGARALDPITGTHEAVQKTPHVTSAAIRAARPRNRDDTLEGSAVPFSPILLVWCSVPMLSKGCETSASQLFTTPPPRRTAEAVAERQNLTNLVDVSP
jgi:hypothetical protein